MVEAIRYAVVLAAGRGTRMGEATADMPKPMLRVRSRPILEHILERLAAAAVERFLVVVGYRREAIQEYFRDPRLEFRVQEVVNGTGTAALLARDFAGDAPFLLTFGDILCAASEYVRCAETLDAGTAAVVGVRDVDDPWRGAAVYEENGVITRLIEKPPPGTSTTRWNSAGLFALRPIAFEYLERLQPSPRGEYELTGIFDPMIAGGLTLRISPVEGRWRDMGYPEDLEAENR